MKISSCKLDVSSKHLQVVLSSFIPRNISLYFQYLLFSACRPPLPPHPPTPSYMIFIFFFPPFVGLSSAPYPPLQPQSLLSCNPSCPPKHPFPLPFFYHIPCPLSSSASLPFLSNNEFSYNTTRLTLPLNY